MCVCVCVRVCDCLCFLTLTHILEDPEEGGGVQSYFINSGSWILGTVSAHTAAEIKGKTTYTVPLLVLGQQLTCLCDLFQIDVIHPRYSEPIPGADGNPEVVRLPLTWFSAKTNSCTLPKKTNVAKYDSHTWVYMEWNYTQYMKG